MKRPVKIILLGLALVLIIAAYTVMTNLNKEEIGESGVLLANLDSASVSALIFGNEEGLNGFEKIDGEWECVSTPEDFTLDKAKLGELVNSLGEVRSETHFESADFAEYGLENPSLLIFITDANGEYSFSVGNKNSVSNEYYSLFGDNKTTVYMLPSEFVEKFDVAVSDFAETTVAETTPDISAE